MIQSSLVRIHIPEVLIQVRKEKGMRMSIVGLFVLATNYRQWKCLPLGVGDE